MKIDDLLKKKNARHKQNDQSAGQGACAHAKTMTQTRL